MEREKRGKLILTSKGLSLKSGFELVKDALWRENFHDKKIALIYEPYYSIREQLFVRCKMLGFEEENIFFCGPSFRPELFSDMDYIYVTEGNTFEVLDTMRQQGFTEYIKKAVEGGTGYIGASAGAIIAGTDIMPALSMDLNFVHMKDFTGLGLFDGVVFPHTEAEKRKEALLGFADQKKCWKEIRFIGNNEILIL